MSPSALPLAGGNQILPLPITIPISPHLADLQPKDPAKKFAYSELDLILWIAGKEGGASTGGGLRLYGADKHADTMLTLNLGEWVRIIAQEVATVDLTKITPRMELRRPEATRGESGAHDVTEDNQGVCPLTFPGVPVNPDSDNHKATGALRTTLVSMDRIHYQVGDEPIFEVTVENVDLVIKRLTPRGLWCKRTVDNRRCRKLAPFVCQRHIPVGGSIRAMAIFQ
jgi:hypothetical protein